MNEIEIIIDNPEQGITNYEPIKAWALEQAAVYGSLIVNPDAIKDAKADCAKLRKLAKSASDLRIRIQKEHAAKIATVTAQLQDITSIFNDAASKIDTQVKEYDEQRKELRRKEIEAIYTAEVGDMAELLPLFRISDPSWLNKTTNEKTIRADIQTKVINARAALEQIKALNSKHENAMIAAYLEHFNLMDALSAKKRLEELDAAYERRKAEEAKREAEKEEEARREAEQAKEKVEEQKPEEPKILTVIERAEHRLQEEVRQNDLGADNGHLLAYWAAYLDGAKAQRTEDMKTRTEELNNAWKQGYDAAGGKA